LQKPAPIKLYAPDPVFNAPAPIKLLFGPLGFDEDIILLHPLPIKELLWSTIEFF
jgi:hypothetical protein